MSAPAAPAVIEPASHVAWRHAAADLDAVPRSVPAARQLIRLVLRFWGLEDIATTAELVTSELVTNAITASAEAGNPVVRLRVTSRMHAALVSVWDASEHQPVPRRNGAADDLGGRGLVLVEALACRWGAEPAGDGGKTVFAVIARSVPELSPPAG